MSRNDNKMPAICRHLLGVSSDAFSPALTADFHDEQTIVLAPDRDRRGPSHIGRRAPQTAEGRRTILHPLAGSLAELHFAHLMNFRRPACFALPQ
jgi:hypothetical protein